MRKFISTLAIICVVAIAAVTFTACTSPFHFPSINWKFWEKDKGNQTESIPAPISFSTDSWITITAASESGVAQDYYAIGDEKTVTLTTGEEITLQILDFEHDNLNGGGKAGITFGMKNLLNTQYCMNSTDTNIGGWNDCDMRTQTMLLLFSQLPTDLQGVIKTVDKQTYIGDQTTGLVTSADKLFLFSEEEIYGNTQYGAFGKSLSTPGNGQASEGFQYEYWNLLNGSSYTPDGKTNRIKLQGTKGTIWYLRSPGGDAFPASFCVVLGDGSANRGNAASLTRGVCFGFCV